MNSYKLKASLFITIFLALFISSCEENPFQIDFSEVPEPFSINGAEKITTESGLIYYVIEEGVCPNDDEDFCQVNPRDQIRIYYTKRLKRDLDRIISSSYANGVTDPVAAQVNNSSIVTEDGFREGLIGMKEGEKRVLVLPPELAYANNPSSNYTNDSLWIDVELEEIIF